MLLSRETSVCKNGCKVQGLKSCNSLLGNAKVPRRCTCQLSFDIFCRNVHGFVFLKRVVSYHTIWHHIRWQHCEMYRQKNDEDFVAAATSFHRMELWHRDGPTVYAFRKLGCLSKTCQNIVDLIDSVAVCELYSLFVAFPKRLVWENARCLPSKMLVQSFGVAKPVYFTPRCTWPYIVWCA